MTPDPGAQGTSVTPKAALMELAPGPHRWHFRTLTASPTFANAACSAGQQALIEGEVGRLAEECGRLRAQVARHADTEVGASGAHGRRS